MDKDLEARMTALVSEVIDEMKVMPDINFQANPTRSIQLVIRVAIKKGWDAFANSWGVVDGSPGPAPTPDLPYYQDLEARLRAAERRQDRTESYRLTAELEDISDGHWSGPRTDDAPDGWALGFATRLPNFDG